MLDAGLTNNERENKWRMEAARSVFYKSKKVCPNRDLSTNLKLQFVKYNAPPILFYALDVRPVKIAKR